MKPEKKKSQCPSTCQKFFLRIQKNLISWKRKCGGTLRKFWMIMWKNMILRKRHWILTLCNIFVPILLCLLLVSIKVMLDSADSRLGPTLQILPEQTYNPKSQQDLMDQMRSISTIGYLSTDVAVKGFLEQLAKEIQALDRSKNVTMRGFESEAELESSVLGSSRRDRYNSKDKPKGNKPAPDVAFVIKGLMKSKEYPRGHKISYTIRMNGRFTETNKLMPNQGQEDCDSSSSSRSIFASLSGRPSVGYDVSGFTGLQILMDKMLIQELTKRKIEPEPYNISVNQFPCPERRTVRSVSLDIFGFLFPFWVLLMYGVVAPTIVRAIVAEKESGIKELLKMIGIPNYLHWLGWMADSLIVLTISSTIFLLMFLAVGFFLPCEFGWWWIFFLAYNIWTTTFSFLISSLFDRASIATIATLFMWLGPYLALKFSLSSSYGSFSLLTKMLICLGPNMGMDYGLWILFALGKNLNDQGVCSAHLTTTLSTADPLTLGHVILMLLVGSILNTALALYLESIIPAKFGVPKPFYFPILPSTWGLEIRRMRATIETLSAQPASDSFEPVATDLPVGLEIINLKKKFGKKFAVDGISLKAFEGQIFCLLGHNGAGKTTAMSILTGLTSPTSGTAYIDNKDIRTRMAEIRDDLGLCPQENFLFPKLTVKEHLSFFGRVKGLTSSQTKEEVQMLMTKLKLLDKANSISSVLSGGQKRRLCLGCAIIGKSKVLFLDECSSGLDPEVRRVVWDLLLEIREQKTIILTTHFMEEADVLGDRVAIMAAGKIQCCGSPSFLKKFYGTGYTLSVSIQQHGVDPPQLLKCIQHHTPDASIKSAKHNEDVLELGITIPAETDGNNSRVKFPALLSDLLGHKGDWKILDVAIAETTMDEVFLKVDEESHANPIPSQYDAEGSEALRSGSAKARGVVVQIFFHFLGLIFKKFWYTVGKWKVAIVQIMIPVVCALVCVFVANYFYGRTDNPQLLITPSTYPHHTIFVSHTKNKDEDVLVKSLVNRYFYVVEPRGEEIVGKSALLEELLKRHEEEGAIYFQNYLVAAEFPLGRETVAWYSGTYPHLQPLSVNLLSNALLQHEDKEANNYKIELTVHPLSNDKSALLDDMSIDENLKIIAFSLIIPLVGTALPVGFSLFAATFVLLPIEERISQAKQLQLMSGVNPILYWGSSFLWDFFLYVLCTLFTLLILYYLEIQTIHQFTCCGGAVAFFIIVIVAGINATAFSYLMSLWAKTPAGGFTRLAILFAIVNHLGLNVAVFNASTHKSGSEAKSSRGLPEDALAKINTILWIVSWLLRLFPGFGVTQCLAEYSRLSVFENSRCNIFHVDGVHEQLCEKDPGENYASLRSCCSPNASQPKPYFERVGQVKRTERGEWGRLGIPEELAFMLVMAGFYAAMLMNIEFRIFQRLLNKGFKQQASAFHATSNDQDVWEEKQRVQDIVGRKGTGEEALVVQDLCKGYGSFSAVSRVSFVVHYGECFGLLGVNGAGKTTLFKMLTGDEMVSTGNAWISQVSLDNNRSKFLQKIGYCPQFDGIIGVLSGKQMLMIFALLRGVPVGSAGKVAQRWLERFGLQESGSVQCQKYSGGMKRRLSTAMAVIGDPPIIFLDEPTSGVDPASRRNFWGIISTMKGAGQSIVLTSHSMEECENVCARLGIMVNGELQCLGRVQHLKNKFAQGYSLTLRLKADESGNLPQTVMNALHEQIITKLSPCTLKDYHQNLAQFHIETPDMSLDKVFEIMEGINKDFAPYIQEYTVQPTTLEEIFISFAKERYGARTNTRKCLFF